MTEPGAKPAQETRWYALPTDEAVKRLGTEPEAGLADEDVRRRLDEYGTNELIEAGRKGPWRILRDQLISTMVLVLIAAALVSALIGSFKDAGAILAIVVLNAVLGFVQEYRAEQAMAALRRLSVPSVRVRRNGRTVEVSSPELVPGDILLLEDGNLVPADGRVIRSSSLRVQEAALTGESETVEKSVEPLENGDIALGDRVNMVYRGTYVTYGHGSVLVTATGMQTELGRIAELIQNVESEQTPLQRRLAELGKGLVVLSLAVAALVFLLGWWRGEPLSLMFMTAVSIAVAAIPEGLPAVVTIALALGAQRMLRRKALIRKLPAVETLGSVTVVCSDKTGTLTENRMTVTMLDVSSRRIDLAEHLSHDEPFFDRDAPELRPVAESAQLQLLLVAGSLCNDAELEQRKGSERFRAMGDPTEAALVVAAARFGWVKAELEKDFPRCGDIPFDSERKRMATVHEVRSSETAGTVFSGIGESAADFERMALVKGAVDSLLTVVDRVWTEEGVVALDEEWRGRIQEAHESLAAQGLRVLGVAWKPTEAGKEEDIESELIFVGFFGIVDPPREEVRAAIARSRSAGIRPIMITGDHPLTARYIARQLGIAEDPETLSGRELDAFSADELDEAVESTAVFARVTPEHKLRIVEALQKSGQVVAMTGDGVNDAPALRRADIGVAMGITGTDVAKEAADMVLLDDNFTTIVAAVEEGRTIYDNIRKFVKFSIAGNLGKILFVVAGPLLGMPLPLLPLQILWLNLLTDGLLGLGLSVEKSEPGIMERKPVSRGQSFFAGGMIGQIVRTGLLIGVIPLAAGWWLYSDGDENWQTAAFTLLAFSQLWQSVGVRASRHSVFRLGLFSNRAILFAGLAVIVLQAAVVYLPALQNVFSTRALPPEFFVLSLVGTSVVFWFLEAGKRLRRRGRSTPAGS